MSSLALAESMDVGTPEPVGHAVPPREPVGPAAPLPAGKGYGAVVGEDPGEGGVLYWTELLDVEP